MSRPFYVVFAGVNGAGKSTFYRSGLWRTSSMPNAMERVNPDELLQSFGGDWQSASDQIKAGKLALERIENLFARNASFNVETTLTGHIALRNIQRAHSAGYRVHLYYIGVDCAQTALDRIRHRTELGGHSISEKDVRRRFDASLANLSRVLDYCECVTALDNTRDFSRLAQWHNGTLRWWGNPKANGPWLFNAMLNETWRA